MQLKIQSEDLDFSYAGFYNLNLDICDITLVNGNVEFRDAHIIETEILLEELSVAEVDILHQKYHFVT